VLIDIGAISGATPQTTSATWARLMTRDPITEAQKTRWRSKNPSPRVHQTGPTRGNPAEAHNRTIRAPQPALLLQLSTAHSRQGSEIIRAKDNVSDYCGA
jgi:hypothetical protein